MYLYKDIIYKYSITDCMKYYLVAAIDLINLGKVEILRQYINENTAIGAMKSVAMEMVKKNGGERQLECTDIDDISPSRVARASCSKYPTGYYVKRNGDVYEIYEKYVECGWLSNTYKIHKIKVIDVIEIELDDNMKLKCDKGTLHKSIYQPIHVVPFMAELKRVLLKRKLMLEQHQKEEDIMDDFYVSDDE